MLAKTTTHRQRYWLKHVKAADLSDGTMADYATTHDVNLKLLYQWKTKLIKLNLYQPIAVSSVSDFIPVKPSAAKVPLYMETPPVPTNESGCTVTLPDGIRVEFHGELSAGAIRSIMSSVSQGH